VFNGPSAQAFAAATAPLISNYGEGLTLWRDGNVVHWSYDGQTVVVALQFDGTVEATFIDRPATDVVTEMPAQALYARSGGRPYRLTPSGCSAMIADMMAFFAGDREPAFSFTGFR
jgi:hypothetical protein